MKNITNKLSGVTLFVFLLLYIQVSGQENENYWKLVPGIQGDHILKTDSGIVFITVDRGWVNEFLRMRNTLHFYHINFGGEIVKEHSFNLSDTEWIEGSEILRSLGRHKVHRLDNGNILFGGHGEVVSPQDTTDTDGQKANTASNSRIEEKQYHPFSKEKDESFPMLNPMIITFNAALDSVLRIDTLARVPAFGAVTLIHEVAPDTIIIGYHKSEPANQVIMETDSLFNVRWSTEFGMYSIWEADIYEFQVTKQGDYLVSMNYTDRWVPHSMGNKRNVLFKFAKENGELLWQKEIWTGKGVNKWASMASWQDDKVVIALDDCCKKTTPFSTTIFHEHTGMYLQIRDHNGDIHEEINLSGFLSAFVNVFPGPSAYGDELEVAEEVAPWFIPFQIVRNPDNTYLVTGIQYSHWRMPFGRGFLLKLDEELQPLWARIFEIDKENYIYGGNYCYLLNVVAAENSIFLGGSFVTGGFWSIDSPLYPPNLPWDPLFRMDVFIPLDEHGCYEPGCHLTDNVPYYKLEQMISVSPNPGSEQVTIRVPQGVLEQKRKILFISDLQGREMISQIFYDSQITVPVNDFSPGTYLVYIMSEGHVFRAEKLIVN